MDRYNSNHMFLSIIIPVYKVEPYLRECLDSIAASPLQCWEAILIDDGSPDGCPQICDEYAAKDKRFRVIHQKNAGVAAARNAGLDVAQGQWCWFVDSDDVVDMRPVGDMVTWLQGHKEVDLVMFDLETFDDNEDTSYDTLKLRNTSLRYADATKMVNVPVDVSVNKNDFLMKHICYHHQRLWYHRRGWRYDSTINEDGTAIERQQEPIRFSRGMKTGEDGEFQYKYLMLCQHPLRVHSTIYYYRQREGSASNSPNSRAQVVKDTIQVFDNLLQYMVQNNVKLEPWLTIRLQGTMKILLYSIYKSKQHHKKEMQRKIRNICNHYKVAGYHVFDSLLLRIARCSIPVYCLLLQLNLRIKGLK